MDGNYSDLFDFELAMEGRVRWFDEDRGYGFVVCDETGIDALLHENSVRNFGQSTIAPNTRVSALFVETSKGRRITTLLDLALGTGPQTQPDQKSSVPGIEPGELKPARVKWFSRDDGYGFVNVFGDPQDYFVHTKQVEFCGFKNLSPGEAVAVAISEHSTSVRWIQRWFSDLAA